MLPPKLNWFVSFSMRLQTIQMKHRKRLISPQSIDAWHAVIVAEPAAAGKYLVYWRAVGL